MINASAVNAITSGENEKVKWWEKNGIVTVKLKENRTYAQNEVLATGLPPSITGENVRFIIYQQTSTGSRYLMIKPDGELSITAAITTASPTPYFGVYQC